MLLKTAVLTFLVNAWFLIPFLDYYLTQDLKFKADTGHPMIQHTGVYLTQLFYAFPKFALYGQEGYRDELPMRLGVSMTVGLFMGIGMLACRREIGSSGEKEKQIRERLYKTEVLLVVMAILLIWMATVYFPWDRIYNMGSFFAFMISSLQFLWRIIGLASAVVAEVTAVGLALLANRFGKGLAQSIGIAMMAVAMLDGSWHLQQAAESVGQYEYKDLQSIRWGTALAVSAGEFGIQGADWDMITTVDHPVAYDDAEILSWNKKGTRVMLNVQGGEKGGYVTLPLLDYKGYSARSKDGVITDENLFRGKGAEVCLKVPQNYKGWVEVYFSSPWYWRLSEGISLVTLVLIILPCFRLKGNGNGHGLLSMVKILSDKNNGNKKKRK